MDRYGIEKRADRRRRRDVASWPSKRHPDRFIPSGAIADPNDVTGTRARASGGSTRSTASAPPRCSRPARSRRSPSTTRRCTRSTRPAWTWAFPIFVCAGVPGPRLKFAPQEVARIDTVMYDFPELVFVTRHGCEPWEDAGRQADAQVAEPVLLDVGLRAPKYYPKAIVDYANTRGADKIIYAGYFPMGLSSGAHLPRHAGRPVQGRRVAEVPVRERRPNSGSGGLTPNTAALIRERSSAELPQLAHCRRPRGCHECW